jgi:hypothetical protein
MVKDIWLNLPVKDVKRSREFFTQLGFSFDTKYGHTDVSEGMIVGDKKFVVMLFQEAQLAGFMQNKVTDTSQGNEQMVSLGVDSREKIDELAKRAKAAGATVYAEPAEIQGWMYGCAFIDLDGHRWNGLYMDMSKMPK